MTTTIANIIFGSISNVKKSGDEDGVYFADVEMAEAEGFPLEVHSYCARSDDYAMTGRWVYQQIVDGNIVGEITQLPPTPVQEVAQPISQGTQSL